MTAHLQIISLKMPLAEDGGFSEALLITAAPELEKTTVLIRTPYPRLISLNENSALELALAGYAVVIQSTRGRHGSDGSFVPFLSEEADGSVALEWCTKQPWCNGRLFLVGKSYEGFAAWAASASQACGILGLAVSMTASQPRAWFYEGGVFRQAFAQSWGLSLVYTDERLAPREFTNVLQHARDLAQLYSVDPSLSPLKSLLHGYEDWLSVESLRRIGATFANERAVPLHLTTGWNDIFIQGAIDDARSSNLPHDRIVIGPWTHDTVGQRLIGHVDYGVFATTGEFDVLNDRLAWMQSVLFENCPAKTSFFMLGANIWMTSETWPPNSASFSTTLKPMRLQRAIDDALATEISRSRYVQTPGGRLHDPLLPLAGGFDITKLLENEACVSLMSPPFDTPQQLVGDASFRFRAVCHETFSLIAWLAMALEDQSYIAISSGAISVTPEDTSNELCMALSPFAASLPAGARLVIVLSYSSIPEYARPFLSNVPIRLHLDRPPVLTARSLTQE